MTRKEAIIYTLLNIITLGFFNLILASIFDLYNENAWYNKWQYWFFGALCLIFPVFVMFIVFLIQMITTVAQHIDVHGSDLYGSPYTWILCLIIPVVGWICLLVMLIYLLVFINVKLIENSEVKHG